MLDLYTIQKLITDIDRLTNFAADENSMELGERLLSIQDVLDAFEDSLMDTEKNESIPS